MSDDLVRPFVMTGGRTRAADTLRVETLVQTTANAGDAPFDAGRIIQLCRTPHSVAEVSAKLGFRWVWRVLVGDLALMTD